MGRLILLVVLVSTFIVYLHHTQRMDNARKLIEIARGIK